MEVISYFIRMECLMQQILIQQESLSVKLEGIQREQKEFRDDIKGQLNRILRKLDSQSLEEEND